MNTESLRAQSQLSAEEKLSRSPAINESRLLEAQKMLKEEMDAVKRHLFAQAKSVDAFNRTVILLERERSQQFNKIRAFQEELRRLGQVIDRQNQDSQLEKRFQGLSQELSGKLLFLRGLIEQRTTHRLPLPPQHLQTPLPGCSPGLPLCESQTLEALGDLTQEIFESKKFLWEELESIRAEIDDIKQKLSKYSFISMATESINPLLTWMHQPGYRSA
ncbi:coiled-coil domain-containing protein 159-like [Polyodon spathula]|uniref:coiled-coil domain-containing protein 159-like n=1 Tax=Polyodon spathula TaxID=7913 RepID=UPI001B7E8750|nr:coiled-coil domain-containing protein 159-like [Polyodon spathula]